MPPLPDAVKHIPVRDSGQRKLQSKREQRQLLQSEMEKTKLIEKSTRTQNRKTSPQLRAGAGVAFAEVP
jgi:hypothetical protein